MKTIYRIFDKQHNNYFDKWGKSTWEKPAIIINKLQTIHSTNLEVHILPGEAGVVMPASEFILTYTPYEKKKLGKHDFNMVELHKLQIEFHLQEIARIEGR